MASPERSIVQNLMIFGVCDSYYISLACQTLPESQKIRCGLNLWTQVCHDRRHFHGCPWFQQIRSRSGPEAARSSQRALREPQQPRRSPEAAQESPGAATGMTTKGCIFDGCFLRVWCPKRTPGAQVLETFYFLRDFWYFFLERSKNLL